MEVIMGQYVDHWENRLMNSLEILEIEDLENVEVNFSKRDLIELLMIVKGYKEKNKK